MGIPSLGEILGRPLTIDPRKRPESCCGCSRPFLAHFHRSERQTPVSGYRVTFAVAKPLERRSKLTQPGLGLSAPVAMKIGRSLHAFRIER
jgi:hypothetical protein